MFERQIFRELRAWAADERRKPLILRGARQVGKTTVVKAFGREFDDFIYLNLERPDDAALFRSGNDVKTILRAIRLLKQKPVRQGRTLLFIDEIQCEPKAVAALRYFYEDLPDLFVISAGSVLQSLLRQRVSFPVGRVSYLSLRPCSFYEFLDAVGERLLRDALAAAELPPTLHDRAMQLFREYALVGGMPEAVAAYAEHGDFMHLTPIYDALLTSYDEDVEKYAPNRTQVEVMRALLDRGWTMAGQTVTLGGFGNTAYKAREVGEAFTNLEKAFLCELVYPVLSAGIPLLPAMRRAPKLFWLDGGLVGYRAGIRREVFDAPDITDAWRGHMAEQWVAQELATLPGRRFNDRRHFWMRNAKSSTAEVDFVLQHDAHVVPIEVKSGSNAHLKSLHLFMEDAPHDVAVRVWSGPYAVNEVSTPSGKRFRLFNVPFYYVGALTTILERAFPRSSGPAF